ncbi:MAG: retrotransposon gag domain-containing protein [Sweet potato little leaf phytoplasma]|nr:retrotransposon gag domain-containing protein [Sweet potato little leaf phytoplasma]
MSPKKTNDNAGSSGTANDNPMTEADLARIIDQRLANLIPNMVSQIQQTMNSGIHGDHNHNNNNQNNNHNGQGDHHNPDPPRQGCSYKYFASCNPPTFSGSGGAAELIRWIEGMEDKQKLTRCLDEHKVSYATSFLTGQALSWWKYQVRAQGAVVTDAMTWPTFVTMIREQYCPMNEVEKLQEEFWHHTMVGSDIQRYNERFHELNNLLPAMIPTEPLRVAKYLKGLAPQIQGMVTSATHPNVKSAMDLAAKLVDQAVTHGTLPKKGAPATTTTPSAPPTSTNASTTNPVQPTPNPTQYNNRKRKGRGKNWNNQGQNQNNARNFVAVMQPPQQQPQPQNQPERKKYVGNAPKCNRCPLHHYGPCPICPKCI